MTHAALRSMSTISTEVRSFFSDFRKGEMYLEEAEFGLRRVLPLLEDLPAGARVLEVGSGPCIVLAELVQRYPHLNVHGIEPMSDGFAFFDDFIAKMETAIGRLNVHRGGYESFPADGNWDLIFLVNVFEHLPNWQDFLDFAERSLAEDGRCVVLCPNYGFPYESHFKLPIILNKKLTGKVFRSFIERFEDENDNAGLFCSLNFVTLSKVRRAVRQRNLELDVNTDIIREMIDRLDQDPSFRQRQGLFSIPATFLKRSGLLDPMLGCRPIQNYLPYMQFTLRRST